VLVALPRESRGLVLVAAHFIRQHGLGAAVSATGWDVQTAALGPP
jgi:hypothetical protein